MKTSLKQLEMHKEFIPYEEALAMKELGYKGDIIGMYDEDKDLFTLHDQDDIEDEWLPAPLYQQAFRWFREKYGLYGTSFPIPFEDDRFFEYNISNNIFLMLFFVLQFLLVFLDNQLVLFRRFYVLHFCLQNNTLF